MKIKKLMIPIYDTPFTIIVAEDVEKVSAFFAKQGIHFGRDNIYAHTIRGRRVMKTPEGKYKSYTCIYVVLNKNNPYKELDNGTIAHEALHVLEAVWDRIGETLNTDYPEPQNYLLGWIVNEIHKVINN